MDRRSERSEPKHYGNVMSVNSSSSPNASLPCPPLTSCISPFSLMRSCITSTVGALNVTTFTIISILFILPLCIFVIYMGVQRWRQQGSMTAVSLSDFFTYNTAVFELMSVLGFILSTCSVLTYLPGMMELSIYLFSINLTGQTFFQILTCVERYLAVVHPITYLSLRGERGIRIRNISVGCVWLLCISVIGVMSVGDQNSISILVVCTLTFTLIVISFCSLSVLCVLIRAKPGEGGGGRQQVDQSKLRAFYTIMTILGVLLVRFGGTVIISAAYASPQQTEADAGCIVWLASVWFSLPSSLVLPLLFLHRVGKPLCCKNRS